MNYEFRKNMKMIVGLFFLTTMIIGVLGSSGAINPSLELKMKRNVGTDMGDNYRIEGDWTITVTGSSDIVFIVLQFNGENITNASGASLKFQFNTRNYAIGDTNITAIGWTAEGAVAQSSKLMYFMDPEDTDAILIWTFVGVGGLFALIIIIKVYQYKKQKTAKPIQKTDVSIEKL
jgi:hypothetical protein